MKPKLPADFLKLCNGVTAKRPRTVIQHILKHGHITTQDLKDTYERLKHQTEKLQKNIPGYVKEIVRAHLKERETSI